MMRVAGGDERGAEAAGDSDQKTLLADNVGDRVRRAETVLDRQHRRLAAEQRPDRLGGSPRVHRLRRDHDQLHGADVGRPRRRRDRHRRGRRSRPRRAAPGRGSPRRARCRGRLRSRRGRRRRAGRRRPSPSHPLRPRRSSCPEHVTGSLGSGMDRLPRSNNNGSTQTPSGSARPGAIEELEETRWPSSPH